MNDSGKKAKLSRRAKTAITLASLLLVYTLVGFFLIPVIVKSKMQKLLPELTHRSAVVQAVRFNPFTLGFGFSGLSLTETNGGEFASVGDFHAGFRLATSLARRAWVFRDITIVEPAAHVIRRQDGSFNFDNARSQSTGTNSGSSTPTVMVDTFRVQGAQVWIEDHVPPQAFGDVLAPIDLLVTNFSNHRGDHFNYICSVATDAAESVNTSGKMALEPLEIAGQIKIGKIELKRYMPYLQMLRGEMAGELNLRADYNVGTDTTVSNVGVQLSQFIIKAQGNDNPVVAIPSLTIDLEGASLGSKSAHVTSVKSSGGRILAQRKPDGAINLAGLVASPGTPDNTSPSAPWSAKVDDINFDNYAVQVEDQTTSRPVHLDIHDLALGVHKVVYPLTSPIAIETSMRCNGAGKLIVSGTVLASPPTADLEIALTDLAVAAFQPYWDSMIKVGVTNGDLTVQGKAHYSKGASFTGDVVLQNLATRDLAHDRDFIKLDKLAVTGINVQTEPEKLQIGQIALAGFAGNIMLDSNREPNALEMLPKKSSAPSAPAATNEQPPVAFSLGGFTVEKLGLHIVDESMHPNSVMDLQNFTGSISNLSTQGNAAARVNLQGTMNQFAQITIKGEINPTSKIPALDMELDCKELQLAGFDPYMQRYGGYPLNAGKLLLELQYNIAEGRLNASNRVVIDDMTLGQRNSSPDATKLPVKLGVALLKDRHGKIILNIPLTGNLNDPSFRVFPLIMQVVRNLLEKAAFAPFKLLGEAGGGGGEEMSFVQFAPGSATLDETNMAKLRKLNTALDNRPALKLDISGTTDPAADSEALAQLHLEQQLKTIRAKERGESVEVVQIEAKERPRLLRKLYRQTFGTSAIPEEPMTNAPATNALAVRPAPPVEATHILRGGQLLIEHGAPASRPAPAPAPSAAAPPPPESPAEEMEKRLLSTISITDDDLRALMQARAEAVRDALLHLGNVPAERLLLLKPLPIERSAKGETQAKFALE